MKTPNLQKFFKLLIVCMITVSARAQQKIISGKVTDNKGQPLGGATILEKRTHKGTATKEDGSFTIHISDSNSRLVISYVGYKATEVAVNNQTFITVTLLPSTSNLDDIVVIGYGTARKKDLTGAIASVQEKDFNKGNFISPDLLIQGKVAGLQIISNTGQPGDATTIKIRGNSALTGTGQPLFVIDGVPLDGRSLAAGNNPLNFLNPVDVASIDILKDASATAIYGSRAAYGVIIINTKKGQVGPVKLDVTGSVGVSSILKKIQILNASQYRDAIKYYGVGSFYDKGADVDAFDELVQNAFQQNYSITGSGGNENGKHSFSVGYLDQDGILINSNFKRYNADVSTNFRLLSSKKLGLDLYLNASQYIQDGTLLGSGADFIIQGALQWNPTQRLNNDDGSFNLNLREGGGYNPLALLEYLRDNLKISTILGSISPYYKFTSWLEYKLLFSINYSTSIGRHSEDQRLQSYDFNSAGKAAINNNELTTQQITHTLSLNREIFHGMHLDAVAGFEYMKFTNKGFTLSGDGVPGVGYGNYGLDYTNYVQYSDAGRRSISSFVDPLSELQSFFGRTIFNYKDVYLLTTTIRADGSTKFGTNNKYGYFPSFAAAWNIHKEKFFKVEFINALKIRGGWGKTGNQEFPSGSAQALYAFEDNGNIRQTNTPNPDLKWQSDRQYDIGIDFSIFNERISGTVDYFNKATTNLLFPSPPIQPAPQSSTIRWINLDGKILNKGLETTINASIVKQEKFGLDLSVNTTFLKNNLSGLIVPVHTGFAGGPVEIIENGLPMQAFYTRKFLGLDKTTGFSVYEGGDNSFYHVGDPNPKTLLGISTTIRYKKCSLIANINGAFGQDIFFVPLMNLINASEINGGRNIALSVYEDPVKEKFANPVTPSSRFIFKGNYLKMGNLTLSYSPGDVAKNFKSAAIYVTARNLFVVTNYPGFDPEVNTNAGVNGVPSFGIDYQHYPTSRSIIFGINFSL